MMSVIMSKSDYILNANQVYFNLKEYESILEKEIQVISYIKCKLLRNEQLDDFNIGSINVVVYGGDDEYDLYFDTYRLKIEVYNKQIVSSILEKI